MRQPSFLAFVVLGLFGCSAADTPAVDPSMDAGAAPDVGASREAPAANDAAAPDATDGDVDASADATSPTDGALTDASTDADADAGATPACALRPFASEETSNVHTTTPSGFGAMGALTVEVSSDVDNADYPGHPITVYRPTGNASYPVIYYSHAYGGDDHTHASKLFEKLASQGLNVVFVPYKTNGTRSSQYNTLWNGFRAATTQYAARFDTTRVGFVGHSFGGGATPEMARRAFGDPTSHGLASAWGSNGRMMFVMAPWYSFPNIDAPTLLNDHYHQLPNDVRTVIQVYGDDDTNDHQIAFHDIWEKLPQGLVDKTWMLVKSDACGAYRLNAGHSVPATFGGSPVGSGNNALDDWAVGRRIHALAAYALQGGGLAARAVAFPNSAPELALGSWKGVCNDRPVVPMEASSTTPIFSACGGGGGTTPQDYLFDYSQAAHCQWSQTGANGTPPCR